MIESVFALYTNLCELFRNVLLVWVLGLGVVFLFFGYVFCFLIGCTVVIWYSVSLCLGFLCDYCAVILGLGFLGFFEILGLNWGFGFVCLVIFLCRCSCLRMMFCCRVVV